VATILLVEDEAPLRTSLTIGLHRDGHAVIAAATVAAARGALEREPIDLVLVDLRLPDGDALDVLAALPEDGPAAVVMTAYGTIETAVEAMRRGAFDFLAKPFGPERLAASVGRALEHRRLRAELRRRRAEAAPALVGDGAAMVELRRRIAQAAAARVVLVSGETGSGKDLVARAVHEAGRPDAPFVVVNCAALPGALIESELFGHARGAFTGADRARRGLVAEADGGTVFLDEIGEVPLALQPRLLRFLETGEIRPVGADRATRVDVRIVAATHRDLAAEVERGAFRRDLLYRLDGFPIAVPPLRARLEDVPALCDELGGRIARRLGRPARRLGVEALAVLAGYGWPGNVRELEHCLERVALLAEEDGDEAGERVEAGEVDPELVAACMPEEPPGREASDEMAGVPPLAEVERAHILAALDACGGDRSRAAAALGISRSTLRRKLIAYGRWRP
jgi:DNA-binding NtrC family response regulator